MKDINLNNIFLVALGFGLNLEEIIVVANNEAEALSTVNDYYDEPDLVYILQAGELARLLKEIQDRQETFFNVIVYEDTETLTSMRHNYEWGYSQAELEAGKYHNQNATFVDAATMTRILMDSLAKLKDTEAQQTEILLSNNYMVE